MPHNTDKAQNSTTPVTTSDTKKLQKINDNILKLSHHAEIQAKQQPDIIVDFPKTNEACRLLFSRIAVQKSQSPKAALANFLDVLSNAESYRNRIAEQAANALVWNKFYMGTEPESMLPVKEVEALQQIIKEKDEWRAVYIKIIRKTVALDLYYLSTSTPWSLADFLVRLFEYFPSVFKPTGNYEPCPRPFLKSLTPKEMEDLLDIGRKSFVSNGKIFKWLQDRPEENILDALNSEQFREEHHPPTDATRLNSLLHYYLKYISEKYEVLTSIFPTQTLGSPNPSVDR